MSKLTGAVKGLGSGRLVRAIVVLCNCASLNVKMCALLRALISGSGLTERV